MCYGYSLVALSAEMPLLPPCFDEREHSGVFRYHPEATRRFGYCKSLPGRVKLNVSFLITQMGLPHFVLSS